MMSENMESSLVNELINLSTLHCLTKAGTGQGQNLTTSQHGLLFTLLQSHSAAEFGTNYKCHCTYYRGIDWTFQNPWEMLRGSLLTIKCSHYLPH